MTKRLPAKATMRTLHTTDLPQVQGGKGKKEKQEEFLKIELENVLIS